MDVEDNTACVVSFDGFRFRGCIIEQLSDLFGGGFCSVSLLCVIAVQGH